jgi:uncharacterized protein (TIGR03083 family)
MTESGRELGEADPEWTPVSSAAAYMSVRQSLTSLLRETQGASLLPVPACPGWNVRDVVAHLTGICRGTEASLGRGEAGRAPLAAKGLSEVGLGSLLAEWERSGSEVESALGPSPGAAMMVMDAFTHELDVRYALGAPFPVGHPAFRNAFDVVVGGLSRSVAALGLLPFRLETDGASWIAGEGEPVAVVRGSRADLYRSLAGRRSYQQISQLAWSTDPGPWLPAFCWGPFRPPDRPLGPG